MSLHFVLGLYDQAPVHTFWLASINASKIWELHMLSLLYEPEFNPPGKSIKIPRN